MVFSQYVRLHFFAGKGQDMSNTVQKIPETQALSLLTDRVTHRKRSIQAAFHESRDFRTLCEDYESCSIALDRWNRIKSAVAVQRREEYTALLAELDQEIQDWLDSFESDD